MTNIKTEEDIAIENSSKRFVKIIILKTIYNIEKHYNKSIAEYLKAVTLIHKRNLTTEENKQFAKFVTLFNLDCATVEKLIGRPSGIKRITKDVINFCVNNGDIEILNACNINYSSGKSFTHNRCYYLPVKLAEKYLNNKDVLNTNSSFYTKKEHKLIDKYIFKYNNKAVEEVSEKEISQKKVCHNKPVQKEISQKNTQPATSSKPAISKPALITKKEIMKKNNDIIDEQDVLSSDSVIVQTNLRQYLQEYIDKGYITKKFGKRMWSYIYHNENVNLETPRTGHDDNHSCDKEETIKRYKVLVWFYYNYKQYLSEKDIEKFKEKEFKVINGNLRSYDVDVQTLIIEILEEMSTNNNKAV